MVEILKILVATPKTLIKKFQEGLFNDSLFLSYMFSYKRKLIVNF